VHEYRRPELPRLDIRDADGNVIPYGSRWGVGSPPNHTYSVVGHPERFAPLQEVARALIAALITTFDVVRSDREPRTDRFVGSADIVDLVVLTPRRSTEAPMGFAFTGRPGVRIAAGLLHTFNFPQCGCDACDEEVDHLAAEMEKKVFAVTAGHFSETVGPGRQVSQRIWSEGWSEGGSSRESLGLKGARRAATLKKLKSLPDNTWQPWSPRATADRVAP